MIVSQLSNRKNNTEGGICFVKEVPKKTSYLCTHSGSSGHSRGTCPIVIGHMDKNFKTASNRKTNHVKTKESPQRDKLGQKKKIKNVLAI